MAFPLARLLVTAGSRGRSLSTVPAGWMVMGDTGSLYTAGVVAFMFHCHTVYEAGLVICDINAAAGANFCRMVHGAKTSDWIPPRVFIAICTVECVYIFSAGLFRYGIYPAKKPSGKDYSSRDIRVFNVDGGFPGKHSNWYCGVFRIAAFAPV